MIDFHTKLGNRHIVFRNAPPEGVTILVSDDGVVDTSHPFEIDRRAEHNEPMIRRAVDRAMANFIAATRRKDKLVSTMNYVVYA